MTPEELAAIRERDKLMFANGANIVTAQSDRRALLAHIDAITEAASRAIHHDNFNRANEPCVCAAHEDLRALVRGTPQR